jgi:hypothetical protein
VFVSDRDGVGLVWFVDWGCLVRGLYGWVSLSHGDESRVLPGEDCSGCRVQSGRSGVLFVVCRTSSKVSSSSSEYPYLTLDEHSN